jgi:thiol-disulfide isomerase/thioredoxin
MVFLSIDENNYNDKNVKTGKTQIEELNKHIADGKNAFILFYMEGCGPCNATRPEWGKLKNVLKQHDNNPDIAIVDIEHTIAEKVPKIKTKPSAFPTIKFISNGGQFEEDFEDSNIDNKERTVESFTKWIANKKIGKQNGGKNKKRKTNRTRKTSKKRTMSKRRKLTLRRRK